MSTALEHIRRAQMFAMRAHGSQKYAGRPYIVHLIDVANVLQECGIIDVALTQAAFLHDVVEDTDVVIGQIEDAFGTRVADLVWAVTGIGDTRAEKNQSMYDKIHECDDAPILKCCDRLANMRQCLATKSGKHMRLYVDEFDEFFQYVVEPALPLPARLVDNLYQTFNQLEKL